MRPLLDDVGGYGQVVAAFRGQRLVHAGRVSALVSPLDSDLVATFINQEYAQLVAVNIPHLYRGFDSPSDDPVMPAGPSTRPASGPSRATSMLGQARGCWLTPMRPTLMEEFRRVTAVKHEWNRSDFVVDERLMPGARIYVGRAGTQTEVFQGRSVRLAGGAIQVWVPRDQVSFLRRNTVWVVR
jgi:hypothetical protein